MRAYQEIFQTCFKNLGILLRSPQAPCQCWETEHAQACWPEAAAAAETQHGSSLWLGAPSPPALLPLGTTLPQQDRAGLLGGIQRARSGVAAAGRRRTDTWEGGCAPCGGALPCQPHGVVTNPSRQTPFLCSYCQMRTFSLHANRSGRGLGNGLQHWSFLL